MRVTISPSDHTVVVDGEAMIVDCSALNDTETPEAVVHSVQWDGSKGHIEFENEGQHATHDADTLYFFNREISDIDQFKPFVDAWRVAKAKQRSVVQPCHQPATGTMNVIAD